ncbi:SRPBCC domain-containing protein [Streptomyces sp. NPDC056144]|uniref:SRPBCC domain-containing protein n=1 Tax=unclassified Streptomyces TaxID=2593676 RepID=UPI0035E2ACE7
MSEIPRGRCETHDGDTHLLRYVMELPHPPADVWEAVATPGGLVGWLCAADPFEPRLDGRVTLRWLNSDTVAEGRVTAWDPGHVAEYTVDPTTHGRIRFHVEHGPGGAGGSAVLRFTNEIRGDRAYRLDCLAGWHDHFERLAAALGGHRTEWAAWTPERWRHLRGLYERDEGPWPRWEP